MLERSDARLEAAIAAPRVELAVDGGGRALLGAVREDEYDGEVRDELERLEHGAVPAGELRPRREEERDVCAERGRELVQAHIGQRLVERLVRELQSGGCVRASAPEARRHRDLLLDRHPPAGLGVRCRRERLERPADERVFVEARDVERLGGLQLDPVGEAERRHHGHDLVLASSRSGPTTSARLTFAGAAPVIESDTRAPY